MRIDKEQIKRLATLPDKELWEEIRRVAAANRFSLPTGEPTHEELERLRHAIADVDRLKISEALAVLNDFRKRTRQ